ncbi:hypothetical protein J2752_001643 [Halarchaeum rubridurum]|uniref:Uncharacterized protein n=1 Tax=Halarchaeum rubridurum TaxID=489911 RepID=A0A830FZ09_9EURY|nr:hypothetical protein [Halarchaeum rubridurum]MBP1954731.1 hypothetical protein [Halarchaeum rubridurum]GGM63414.1 hypothetical protein GCM10009017_11900 [Halarchaeum rubridurum]
MTEHAPTPSDDAGDGDAATENDVWSRRSFVRYLAPVSIAIPIVVETETLVGLLQNDFGENSAWTQPTGVSVGIGGDLRPDLNTREKLQNAALEAVEDGRRLTLAVAVRNTTDAPYRLALGAVTTDGGETVEGGYTTDPVAPGETTSFTAEYVLPADATPASVETTVTIGNQPSERTVQLAPVPTQ